MSRGNKLRSVVFLHCRLSAGRFWNTFSYRLTATKCVWKHRKFRILGNATPGTGVRSSIAICNLSICKRGVPIISLLIEDESAPILTESAVSAGKFKPKFKIYKTRCSVSAFRGAIMKWYPSVSRVLSPPTRQLTARRTTAQLGDGSIYWQIADVNPRKQQVKQQL